jgi:hypothetical protein
MTHGLIVADNGTDMYVTGTFDTRWDNNLLNPAFSLLTASDFDVIQLGWNPPSSAAALAAVGASPNPVVGGNPSTGSVTLTSNAPVGGALVALGSASSSVTVPGSVSVNGGSTSALFGITTSSVITQTLVTVSATYSGLTKTVTVTVNPAASAALATLTLKPTTVKGGGSVTGTATLTAPAPIGGATVTLTSSNGALASVPSSVLVAAGATSKTFAVSTVRTRKSASIAISASYAGVTKTAKPTVKRR